MIGKKKSFVSTMRELLNNLYAVQWHPEKNFRILRTTCLLIHSRSKLQKHGMSPRPSRPPAL